MRQIDRENISAYIRHELQDGEHTYTQCSCGRHGCRSSKCWECWLRILVYNEPFLQDSLHKEKK